MSKRVKILTGLILLLGTLLGLYILNSRETKPFTLALVGPMSGPDAEYGKAMRMGAELFVDEINARGGINGRKLRLEVYNDKNDLEKAEEVARTIAQNSDVLGVLGHYYSTTSLAAAPIYEEAGIVMISASATDDAITEEYEWSFTTLPNSSSQGQFIAHYLNDVLKVSSACVIYDEDIYGTNLKGSFLAEAEKLDLEIRGTWGFSTREEKLEAELFKVSEAFKQLEEPDVIFFATHAKEGAHLVALLKTKGSSFSIFGPDTFASSVFVETLNTYPQERSSPGYYSDNIYTISPFMLDVATQEGSNFAYQFEKRYDIEPDWVAAGYYDAAFLVATVLERSGANFSNKNPWERRVSVQKGLTELYDYQSSCRGVNGPIFFTPEGNIAVPRSVGSYHNQRIISTPYQYQAIDFSEYSKELLNEILNQDVLLFRDRLMRRTRVVYTGVDINEITDFDLSNFTYFVDFYIWFRYEGDFSVEEIQFVNAVNPLELEQPFFEQDMDGTKTKAYHVQASFKSDFLIKDYPFDQHTIQLKIRHGSQTRDRLIFATDILGIRDFNDPQKAESLHRSMEQEGLNGWKVVRSSFFEDTVINDSTLGRPQFFKSLNSIEFSQFNSGIAVRRDVKAFAVKNLLPIIIVMLLTYLIYYLSYEKAEMRISIGMSMLLTAAFFHIQLTSGLNVSYLLAVEYIFFTFYILCALVIFISLVGMWYLDRVSKLDAKEDNDEKALIYKKLLYLDYFGRFVHPVVMFGVIGILIYAHYISVG